MFCCSSGVDGVPGPHWSPADGAVQMLYLYCLLMVSGKRGSGPAIMSCCEVVLQATSSTHQKQGLCLPEPMLLRA
jgi:hypothetical protein